MSPRDCLPLALERQGHVVSACSTSVSLIYFESCRRVSMPTDLRTSTLRLLVGVGTVTL
jgi:hypothetical protein